MPATIYLDHAASTTLDPEVEDVMLRIRRANPGNPSSLHSFGRSAHRELELAREKVAALLGAKKSAEILFTGSATEANNLALMGMAKNLPTSRKCVLASPLEHPSVQQPLNRLKNLGHEVRYLPLDSRGIVDVKASEALLAAPDLGLMTCMAVNNEVGTLQPIKALGAAAKTRGVLFHCDAVQAGGKISLNMETLDCHALVLSGHKIHGPRGVGTLYLRSGTHCESQILGGAQERGRRAGTENLEAIVGFAHALAMACEHKDKRVEHLQRLENALREQLAALNLPVTINAETAPRVPGIVSLRIEGLYGETLLMKLDLQGIAVSLGSACSSGSIEASPVLRAMGLSQQENLSSVRISFAKDNSIDEVAIFAKALLSITKAR